MEEVNPPVDNTDYFAHIENADILRYYSLLVNSTLELTQFNYPEDWNEGDNAIMDHINNCRIAVYTKLNIVLNNSKTINGENFSQELVKESLKRKQEELSELFAPIDKKYFEDVKVTYIDLWESVHDIDFEGHDWSEK